MSVSVVQPSSHIARFSPENAGRKMLSQSTFYYDQENNREAVEFKDETKNILSGEKYGVGGDPALGASESMRASVCAGCNAPITDRYMMRVQPNLQYHVDCLTCCCCKRTLNESCTTFVRASKTYCKQDYYKEFGKRCTRCRSVLERTDRIMRARSSLFHQSCFSCSSCETLLNVGDYYIMRGEEIFCRPDCLGAPGLKIQQQPYFGKTPGYNTDFVPPFMTPPAGATKCSMPLPAQPPGPLHPGGGPGGPKNGFRDVGSELDGGVAVPTTSAAGFSYPHMSGNGAAGNNGATFQMLDEDVAYGTQGQRQGYDMSDEFSSEFLIGDAENGAMLRRKTHSSMSTSSGANSPYSNPDSVTAPSSTNSGCVISTGHTASGTSTSTTASATNQFKKTKKDKPAQRVRTVLTDHQLKVLKQIYSSNQRPDQALKEQLVEITGLSARVIRVWFQNKRCKDKKKQNAIKEFQQNQEKEQTLQGVRMNGVGPLVAESPVAFMHDALGLNGGASALKAVDIRAYPQNPALWDNGGGALSPFPPAAIDHNAHHHALQQHHQPRPPQMMHNMLGNNSSNNNINNNGSGAYGAMYAGSEYMAPPPPPPLDVSQPQALPQSAAHEAPSLGAGGDDDSIDTFLKHSPHAD